MHYYLLDFGYQSLNYPDVKDIKRHPDFELGHGSYYLCAAEEYVEELAKKSGLDLRHAYSWPDGSLYKYLRSSQPIELQTLRGMFEGRTPHAIKSPDGVEYRVAVYLRDARTEDGSQVSNTELLSLSERWDLSREDVHKLFMERHALREKCYDTYHRHRDECSKCPPQGLPCEEGWKLCREAEEAADGFVKGLVATV